MPVHLTWPDASRPSKVVRSSDVAVHFVPRSSRLTKKSFVSVPGVLVKTPCDEPLVVRAEDAQAADEDRHLGGAQVEQVRPVDQQVLGGEAVALAEVVAEAVGDRLERGEGLHVRLLLRRVRAARREGDLDVEAGVLGGLLDARGTGEDDQVGERDPLAAGLGRR